MAILNENQRSNVLENILLMGGWNTYSLLQDFMTLVSRVQQGLEQQHAISLGYQFKGRRTDVLSGYDATLDKDIEHLNAMGLAHVARTGTPEKTYVGSTPLSMKKEKVNEVTRQGILLESPQLMYQELRAVVHRAL